MTERRSDGDPLPKELPKLYLAKPLNLNRWHVFCDKESLCRKIFLPADPDEFEPVKFTETFRPGQDCKECFRRAGLKIPELVTHG